MAVLFAAHARRRGHVHEPAHEVRAVAKGDGLEQRLLARLFHIMKQLFHLSSLVEENLKDAIWAVKSSDLELAKTVRRRDDKIDELEVEVEENCLKILALHQPVAVDLRFIVAVIKINNDLERIGDHAKNRGQQHDQQGGNRIRGTQTHGTVGDGHAVGETRRE